MNNVKYGSKLYNDLKSSLPDEVFAKKYVSLKPAPKVMPKKATGRGLGGQNLADLVPGRSGKTMQNYIDDKRRVARTFGGSK